MLDCLFFFCCFWRSWQITSVQHMLYANKLENCHPGKMPCLHLTKEDTKPQTAASSKRAWQEIEMYPDSSASLAVWRWNVFHVFNFAPAGMLAPSLWNGETFSEAVSILKKVPITQHVYAHGRLLSISSELSSTERQHGWGGMGSGNASHMTPCFLNNRERARSWRNPGWHLHVFAVDGHWTVDKIRAPGWIWQAQELTLRLFQAHCLHWFYSLVSQVTTQTEYIKGQKKLRNQ